MRNKCCFHRTMDFTSTHYCKISRILLSSIGRWPHQNRSDGKLRTYFVVFILISGSITQVVKLITSSDDMDTVIEGFPLFITALVAITKYFTLVINEKMVKSLQNQINDDWRNLRIEEEVEIMKRYVAQGKRYAIGYMVYIYMTAALFGSQVLEPYILDFFAPLNESRPLRMIYPADYYFFDAEKYYFLVTIHMSLNAATTITTLIASDTMFMMYVQYVCGIFAVIGNRLEHTLYTNKDASIVSTGLERKKYNRYIIECVCIHRKILKFVDFTEGIFSISYLIQLGLNVACMSVTLLQVVVFLGKLEVVKFILYAIGQLFHLYCVAYQGQKLISHSVEMSDRIYSGLWYRAPMQSQKMLLLVLKRTSRPCYLTAGKIFIFSIENFSTVVQNCMSYFMVLASFR